ncbi:MAG: DegV family protein [Coriobacteriales bacterium]
MQRKVRIIADSSANLESDEPGFASVPLRIVAGDREYVDDERLDVDAMLDELDAHKGPSVTACPGIGDWFEAFGDADDVVGVTITSLLSGCHNSAVAAARQHMAAHPGRRVFIFDSLSTGPEMELIVEKLRELAGQGCPFEELRERVASYAQSTRLGFSLESLSNMAKNGRVSTALATAAGLLGIRIVGRASSKGDLEPLHKSRGEKRAIRQLWESMLEGGFAGGKVRIRHTHNEKAAAKLAELVRESFPGCDIRIGANRGLCSYYAERGGLLVGYEGA